MKVRELLELLEARTKQMPHLLENDIYISIKANTVGPTPAVELYLAHFGYDWDRGRFLLWPKEDLKKVGDSNDYESKRRS